MADLTDYTKALELDHRARATAVYMRALGRGSSHEGPLITNADRARYPQIDAIHKASIAAMDTNNLADLRQQSRAFLNVVQRVSIPGQLMSLGATMAPPYAQVPSILDAPDVQSVGEGLPAPTARMDARTDTTSRTKFQFLLPLSRDLVLSTDERGVGLIEQAAIRGVRRAEDQTFLSDQPAIDRVQSAGLLANAVSIGSASPASSMADLLEQQWSAVASGAADRPVYITSPRGGLFLHAMREADSPVFPAAGPLGGSVANVPLLVSASASNKLILVDAARLVFVDDGLRIDRSEAAAIEMSDTPTAGEVTLVPAFQTNLVILRFTRYLSWLVIGDDAAACITLPIDGSPS